MKMFEDSLDTHFFIESVFNRNGQILLEDRTRRILSEEYGLFQGCEDVAKEIVDSCEESAENLSTKMMFILSGLWTSNKNNYAIVNIKPKLDWVDNIKVVINPIRCSYSQNKSTYELYMDENRQLRCKYTNLVINVPFNIILRHEYAPIMHELTHAYEDNNRRQNNSQTLDYVARKIGYDKTTNYLKSSKISLNDDDLLNNLSLMLYYFNDFEINSFTASIVGRIKTCEYKFLSVTDALDWVRSHVEYRVFMKLCDFAENLFLIQDKAKQEYILAHLNAISNYNFKTYSNFLKWVEKKTTKYKKRIEVNVAKAASKYLIINRRR